MLNTLRNFKNFFYFSTEKLELIEINVLRKFNLCRTQQINSNWEFNLMSLVIYCVFHPEIFSEKICFLSLRTIDLFEKWSPLCDTWIRTGFQYFEGLSAVILEGTQVR